VIERVGKTTDLQVVGLFTIRLLVFLLATSGRVASAQESAPSQMPAPEATQSAKEPSSISLWRYGAYLDLSYPVDFNFPENHQWRSKVTTQRVNDPNLNMALAYVRKVVNESSRWGMELAAQTGRDVNGQIPNATLRFGDPYNQAETFSHFSRANVSYLAPVGTGLTLTAGLVSSTVSYESFYAKDNFNYTRSLLADYSPYFMAGLFARYQFTEAVKTAFGVINRYNFLSQPNNLPSYVTQFKWTDTSRITFTQNLYYGPDQTNAALEFWRFFSDSILEWNRDDLTIAVAYDIGTERAIPQAGGQRSFWTGSALFSQWRFMKDWAVGLRPELYYDPDGTMTGARQFIKGVTATLDYKVRYAWTTTLFRLEYRFNNSTGPQGGFYTGGQNASGMIGLTPSQNLLFFSILWSFDSP
jgi:hypothetical protein